MSSFILKILGCITMLIDHIGYMYYPDSYIWRAIGRLAFPIFAFQIGIGYQHTKNREKYILRMLIFALVSQIPFWMFSWLSEGEDYSFLFNVGATLLLGLIAIYSYEHFKNIYLKVLCIAICILLAHFLHVDYGFYGVLMILLFYLLRNHKYAMAVCFYILVLSYCAIKKSAFNTPEILALVPILLFNGKKGKETKHLFYFFYPLHLIVLSLVHLYLFP